MTPRLPDPYDNLLDPLFETYPMDRAMRRLVVHGDGGGEVPAEAVRIVEEAVQHERLSSRPTLIAAVWLYVDDLDRSHRASQSLDTPTGSFWHAIMHRREGDFSNAKYWYRKVGHHPAMSRIASAGGGAGAGTDIGEYDPDTFVDRIERAHLKGEDRPELISEQRREWAQLFEWCLEH